MAVDKSFFPNSTSPMFTIDFWRPMGSTIEATRENVRLFEDYLLKQEETKSVGGYTGEGALRFILTYTPSDSTPSFGHLVVCATDSDKTAPLIAKTLEFARKAFPEIDPRVRPFSRGTSGGAKIQARFVGTDPDALRTVGEQAIRVMKSSPDAIYIRTDWAERVKLIRPVLNEAKTRQAGLTRQDVAESLNLAFSGNNVGLYRDGEKLVPIVMRPPEKERRKGENLPETPVWCPLAGRTVPLSQLTSKIEVSAEDPMIYRRFRKRTLTVECDSGRGKAGELFAALRPGIERIKLPAGVALEWGGEYESSTKAQGGLMRMIPMAALSMLVILVLLFNGFRQPAIIVLTFPLSIVGVTTGLLLTGRAFDFMAILGFLSLIGMMIKNAIVLLDQVDTELRGGKGLREAVVDSAVSRARPVLMAALTTVLGMIPLYFDVLFSAMAVTIMFGLTFATFLTLLVVPVLCTIFYRKTTPGTELFETSETGGDA